MKFNKNCIKLKENYLDILNKIIIYLVIFKLNLNLLNKIYKHVRENYKNNIQQLKQEKKRVLMQEKK